MMKILNIVLASGLIEVSEVSDNLSCSFPRFEGSSEIWWTLELSEVSEEIVEWKLKEVSETSFSKLEL